MTPTKTDFSREGTITVCELYIQGVLERIPENHIFVMLKMLTYQMKRNSFLGAEGPAIKAYVKVCLSDMETMARRYLHMVRSKHAYYRTWYLKNRYTKERREMYEGRHLIRANTLFIEYYEDIADYMLGTIDFDGHELEIYYDVPVENKHSSLTCFHTNPITMKPYYFKNPSDILPTEELREQFRIQLQSYWRPDQYEPVD